MSTRCAFVSTNSITQGEQVAPLWKNLQGCEIDFAYRTFKWHNEAKGNAAVHCVIIGFHCRNVNSDGCQKASVNTSAGFATSNHHPLRNVSGASEESELIKNQIESAAQVILDVRQKYLDADPACTLAILYNPETMPPDLLKAHQHLDALVDKAYGKKLA